MDTLLFVLFNIRRNFAYIAHYINHESITLKHAMQLMDVNDYDMARYVLTKANTNFGHIRECDDEFDLDSSVGDWLNAIKELTSFCNKKTIVCD